MHAAYLLLLLSSNACIRAWQALGLGAVPPSLSSGPLFQSSDFLMLVLFEPMAVVFEPEDQ
jgi:hypothetical protein